MRAYVATNGVMFGLIVAAHIARLGAEGFGPVREPMFLLSSLLSAGMFAWSVKVFSRLRRSETATRTDA